MKRFKLVTCLFLVALTAQPTARTEFGDDLQRFVDDFNLWVRRYQGCPDHGRTNEDGVCLSPTVKGYNDGRQWLRVRKDAEKLFNLKEN